MHIKTFLLCRSKSEGQENGPSSSDELQSQLDELDLFIAELTQNAEPSGTLYHV